MSEFVPYEQALALKELGFDKECFRYYLESDELMDDVQQVISSELEDYMTLAPLYQQAFKWFLDNHGLWFRPDYPFPGHDTYSGTIHKIGEYRSTADIDNCNSHEEAELACLNKLIELTK